MQEIHFTFLSRHGLLWIVFLVIAAQSTGFAQSERQPNTGLFIRGGLTTLTFDPNSTYLRRFFDDHVPGIGVGAGYRYASNRYLSFAWSLDLATFSSSKDNSRGSIKHRHKVATAGLSVALDPEVPSVTKYFTPRIELTASYSGMVGPSVLNVLDDEDSPHGEFYGYGSYVSISLQPRIHLAPAVTLIPTITRTLVTNTVFGYDEGRLGNFPKGLNYTLGVEFHGK